MRHEQHDFAPHWERAFVEGVKKERVSQGMSQVELAERMADLGYRFDQATVYKIENGKRKVTATEAWGLAEVLDVEVGYLFDWQAAHGTPEARARLIRTQADTLLQQLLELDTVARRLAATHRAFTETVREEHKKGLTYSDFRGDRSLVDYYEPLLSISIQNEVLWRLRNEIWVGDAFSDVAGMISGIAGLGPADSTEED